MCRMARQSGIHVINETKYEWLPLCVSPGFFVSDPVFQHFPLSIANSLRASHKVHVLTRFHNNAHFIFLRDTKRFSYHFIFPRAFTDRL